MGRPYGRIRQGKRAIVLRGSGVSPGEVTPARGAGHRRPSLGCRRREEAGPALTRSCGNRERKAAPRGNTLFRLGDFYEVSSRTPDRSAGHGRHAHFASTGQSRARPDVRSAVSRVASYVGKLLRAATSRHLRSARAPGKGPVVQARVTRVLTGNRGRRSYLDPPDPTTLSRLGSRRRGGPGRVRRLHGELLLCSFPRSA